MSTKKTSTTQTKSKKATKQSEETKKSSARKRRNTLKKKTFNTYITKVLKQVHPDARIGEKEGIPMVNSVLDYVVRKVANAVSLLLRRTGKKTVTSREIQSAVRLVFPGELARHAVSEGVKAVTRYNGTHASGAGGPIKPPPAEGKHSKASRAGLQFSVSRTSKIFYPYVQGQNIRKGAGAAVYLAAILEYICAEILELAGNAARDNKKTSIKPRHISMAIMNDEELNKMLQHTVLQGGVLPNIHTFLLNKTQQKTNSEQ
jgi:histone H2A